MWLLGVVLVIGNFLYLESIRNRDSIFLRKSLLVVIYGRYRFGIFGWKTLIIFGRIIRVLSNVVSLDDGRIGLALLSYVALILGLTLKGDCRIIRAVLIWEIMVSFPWMLCWYEGHRSISSCGFGPPFCKEWGTFDSLHLGGACSLSRRLIISLG